MSTTEQDLLAKVRADIQDFVSKFETLTNTTVKVEKGFSTLQDAAGSLWKQMALGNIVSGALKDAMNGVVNFVKGSINAWIEEEQSIMRLNFALKAAGDMSSETSAEMEEFAKQIQKTTTYSDDQARGLMQLGLSMGVPIDQLQEMTKGAIGLAEEFAGSGLSVETAMRGLAQAMEGNYTALSRYIPQLRSATTEGEKMAIVQKAMTDGFGMAEEKARTTGGQLKQMQNEMGDLQEEIGKVLTEALLPLIREGFEWIQDNKESIIGVFSGIISVVKVLAEVITVAFKAIKFLIDLITPAQEGVDENLKRISFMSRAQYEVQLAEEKKSKEEWAKFSKESQQKLYTSLVNFFGQETDAQKKHKQDLFDIETQAREKTLEAYKRSQEKKLEIYLEGVKLEQEGMSEMAKSLDDFWKDYWRGVEEYKKKAMRGGLFVDPEIIQADQDSFKKIQEAFEATAKAMGMSAEQLKLELDLSKTTEVAAQKVMASYQENERAIWSVIDTLHQLKDALVEVGLIGEEEGAILETAFEGFSQYLQSSVDIMNSMASGSAEGILTSLVSAGITYQLSMYKIAQQIKDMKGVENIKTNFSWLSLSDEQAQRMYELQQQYGNISTAFSMMSSDIIRNSNVTRDNFERYSSSVRHLTEDFRAGRITAYEYTQALGSGFSALVEKMESLKLPGITANMVQIIRDARSTGLQVKEISDFVMKALQGGISSLAGYYKGVSSQAEFNRGLSYTMALFEGLRSEGMSFTEAMAAMDDQFDQLLSMLDEGFTATGGISELLQLRQFAKDNSDLMGQLDSVTKLFKSLGDSVYLTQDLFSQFGTDTVSIFDKLIGAGANEHQALQMMAPLLAEQLWYAKAYGFAISDQVQALIDKAQAEGLNLEGMKTEKQLLGEIAGSLSQLVDIFGNAFPSAVGEAAAAWGNLSQAFANTSIPTLPGGSEYTKGVPMQAAQHGAHEDAVGPKWFYVEPGAHERVDITPEGKGGGGRSINVTIPMTFNVSKAGSDMSKETLAETIIDMANDNLRRMTTKLAEALGVD